MYLALRLSAISILLPVLAVAQAGLGSISGTVVDSTEAVVPNATVKVLQLSTNSIRSTTTNAQGLFTFPSLVASKYTLTITATGFKERAIENLDLNAFQTMTMGNVALEVGTGSVVVNVTAEQAQIVTENAVRATAIQSNQVTEMPLQGRNWATLLKIIPGSVPQNNNGINGREAGYDGYADFRVNGKPPNQTQVNLDGGSNVDHGSDTKTTVTPSLESIQEVSVLTNNFQAEYGQRSGVIVNVVTKSGSNQLHGTAWSYLRNEALNANSSDNSYFGLPRARYRYNYLGGNLGGPIRRDKLFFFTNFEALKQDTPTITSQQRVPTALERNGNFSETLNANGTRPQIYLPGTQSSGNPQLLPGNIIPQELITAAGRAIMNLYPEPNFRNDTTNNYLNQYSREDMRYLTVGKADWNVNNSTRAYVRYNYDYQHYRDLVTWSANGQLPFTTTGWNRPDKALTANVTKLMGPTVVMETLFNWQKDFVNAPLEVSKDASKLDRVKAGLGDLPLAFATSNLLPAVSNTGYVDWNLNRFPWFAKAPEIQIAQNWTWTHGSHISKAGAQYILNRKEEIDGANEKGTFNFLPTLSSAYDMNYGPANVLTGALSSFTQVSSYAHKFSKYQDLHFFVQDTWKVTRTLTLDYGMRLYHIPTEFNTRPKETLDAVFVPSLWDPAKAPRFYVPDPTNTARLIDPAFPNQPLAPSVTSALLFSLVPGSGDPLNGVVRLGDPRIGNAGIRNPNFILFAPRGGFAWQFANKTVLRGGFGWSYARPTIGQAVNNFENGWADSVDYRQTNIANLRNSTVNRLSPRNFASIDESSNAVPTIYDFSLSIQRELPASMVLDVAFIGNLQRHQPIVFNLNQVLPGTSWRQEFIDPRNAGNNFNGPVSASNPGALPGTRSVDANLMRPFRGFGGMMNHYSAVGNNRYNSLQTQLTKRYGHGLTFQFVHTWAKLISGTESFGPFYYRWKDYTGAIANNDRKHVVGINYTYDVPSLAKRLGWNNPVARQIFDGWGIAHLMNFYTGSPTSVSFGMQYASTTAGVANINSIFTGSPDIAPRLQPTASPNTGLDQAARMYNVDTFTLPSIGDVGLGSRNYLKTQSTFSNDINLSKMFPITEKRGLELRASLFNPFNQVRRTGINTTQTYKMKGANLSDGYYLYNTPDQQVALLQANNPNANATERYNQYRTGAGHVTLTGTTVADMRRVEIGLRFKF